MSNLLGILRRSNNSNTTDEQMGRIFGRARQIAMIGVLLFASGWAGHAPHFPENLFGPPLNIPLVLAGNFGELRSGHFHSGLDLKTEGKEGLPILASAGGWISRIKVSPTGYGNALYVSHPEGYTTVYAHLQSFRSDIASHVKEQQYRKQRFAVDLYPKAGRFHVEKGETIALSGNSGGSYGPHLHFEIRDNRSSWPLNPLLFGFDIKDETPPKIFALKIYPVGTESAVVVFPSGKESANVYSNGESATIDVEERSGQFELSGVDQISVYGQVVFSLRTHDYHDLSTNRLGVYRVSLLANDELTYRSEIERFSFNQTRYINAHIDYGERLESRKWFQRSHIQPGNKLAIYVANNKGLVSVSGGERKSMKYEVEDAVGNRSMLSFTILGMQEKPGFVTVNHSDGTQVRHTHKYDFSEDGISLSMPEFTLYDDTRLTYSISPKPVTGYSRVHHVHDPATPMHKRARLTIKVDSIGRTDPEKLLIAAVNENGGLSSLGGSFRDGYVSTRTRNFGSFFIAADSLAPTIDVVAGSNSILGLGDRVAVKIRDDLAGISSYSCFINDDWRLCSFDPRKGQLTHFIDELTPSGTHSFRVNVIDGRGNLSSLSFDVQVD